jgi:rubredoxin
MTQPEDELREEDAPQDEPEEELSHPIWLLQELTSITQMNREEDAVLCPECGQEGERAAPGLWDCSGCGKVWSPSELGPSELSEPAA